MSWLVHKSAMDTVCPCPECVLDWVCDHYFALLSIVRDYIRLEHLTSVAEAFDLYVANDMLYNLAELQHTVPLWAGRQNQL